MNPWTWVLTGFCIAGVLLPLIGAIPVLRLLLRVRSRTNAMRNARLFTSMQLLALQGSRMRHIAAQATPLARRAQVALEQIRGASAASGAPAMRDSLQSAGDETAALLETLSSPL